MKLSTLFNWIQWQLWLYRLVCGEEKSSEGQGVRGEGWGEGVKIGWGAGGEGQEDEGWGAICSFHVLTIVKATVMLYTIFKITCMTKTAKIQL